MMSHDDKVILCVLAALVLFYIIYCAALKRALVLLGHRYPVVAWAPLYNLTELAMCLTNRDGLIEVLPGLPFCISARLFASYQFICLFMSGWSSRLNKLSVFIFVFCLFRCYTQVYSKLEKRPISVLIIVKAAISVVLPLVPIVKFFSYERSKDEFI